MIVDFSTNNHTLKMDSVDINLASRTIGEILCTEQRAKKMDDNLLASYAKIANLQIVLSICKREGYFPVWHKVILHCLCIIIQNRPEWAEDPVFRSKIPFHSVPYETFIRPLLDYIELSKSEWKNVFVNHNNVEYLDEIITWIPYETMYKKSFIASIIDVYNLPVKDFSLRLNIYSKYVDFGVLELSDIKNVRAYESLIIFGCSFGDHEIIIRNCLCHNNWSAINMLLGYGLDDRILSKIISQGHDDKIQVIKILVERGLI